MLEKILALLFVGCGALAPAIACAADEMTLVLAGDSYQGKPTFEVRLGGVVVGKGTIESAEDVSVGTPGRESDYLETFSFSIPNLGCLKTAPLEIELTNDLWVEGRGDRNMYVKSATINSHEVSARGFTLVRAGTARAVATDTGLLPIFTGGDVAVAQAPAGGWSTAECVVEEAPTAVSELSTSLLNFDLVVVNPGRGLPGDGGGLAPVHGGILIAREQSGTLWFYDGHAERLRSIKGKLPPNNIENLPDLTPGGAKIRRELLRYNDIQVASWKGQDYLLASYSYYKDAQACVVSRFATSPLEQGWLQGLLQQQVLSLDWKVVFETSPCLGFNEREQTAFGAAQAGGRMAVDGGNIYLTVGDYEVDGVADDGPFYPQMPDSGYGKVFRISMDDWSSSLVSIGHRNPQGILVDGSGKVWEVEHGPAGGDELNLIVAGENYGWPLVTLGVDYGDPARDSKFWPHSARQGRHDGFRPPVFAWLPSIAPSNMKMLAGINERWDGDFIVGSLVGESLVRLRMDGEHVQYAERIPMGKRIRYVQPAEGRIYLLFDDGEFGYLAPHKMLDEAGAAPAPADETLRRNGCMQCHSAPGAPSLGSLVGTDIASQPGVNYSGALMAKGGAWTLESLRAFLSDPQAFAPGTSMPKPPLSGTALDDVVGALK